MGGCTLHEPQHARYAARAAPHLAPRGVGYPPRARLSQRLRTARAHLGSRRKVGIYRRQVSIENPDPEVQVSTEKPEPEVQVSTGNPEPEVQVSIFAIPRASSLVRAMASPNGQPRRRVARAFPRASLSTDRASCRPVSRTRARVARPNRNSSRACLTIFPLRSLRKPQPTRS